MSMTASSQTYIMQLVKSYQNTKTEQSLKAITIHFSVALMVIQDNEKQKQQRFLKLYSEFFPWAISWI